MTTRPLVFALIALAACGKSKPTEGKAPPVEPKGSGSGSGSSAPAPAPQGLDLAGMDKSVKPGDDFFSYANGGWFKTTEIPADRSAWGSGAITVELTAKRVVEVIQEAAKTAAEGSEARKVGDYYATYMDDA